MHNRLYPIGEDTPMLPYASDYWHRSELSFVLLIQCYGVNYIDHPRMEKLLLYNEIRAKDYLKGAEEAEAFSNKEYIKLHQSTLRKVDVFADILNRTIQGSLKVKSKWFEIYGLSPQGIFEFCKGKWWMQLIISIFMLFLGALLGKFL